MKLFFKEYFQVFLYFMLFNSSVLSLTLVSHEFGHLSVGYFSGCLGKIVMVDLKKNMTYTEIECDKAINNVLLSLGCFLFVIPIAILFLLLNSPERNFFYVIIGLGLSTSSLDIMSIINSDILFFALVTIGTFLVIYGEALLINNRIFATVKPINL